MEPAAAAAIGGGAVQAHVGEEPTHVRAGYAENQTNYEREQARYRQQLAQYMMPWEQAST